MKEINEYIKLKQNTTTDQKLLTVKRKKLLWLNTSTMTINEIQQLQEALN